MASHAAFGTLAVVADTQTEPSACTCFNDLPAGAIHTVFGFLGPRELGVASAVCRSWRDLNKDMAANQVWHGHYAKRWRPPTQEGAAQGWQAQYGRKMRSARAFSSKGLMDILYGHRAAVSSIALLPGCNLLATGSVDSTMRLWDLRAGLPLASSRLLRGTVRALSMDENMLVCGGSQEGAIRLCRAKASLGATRFDPTAPIRLSGHTGPVVSLALDPRCIYSASWDCTVRIWNRETLRRESLLAFPDWVHTAKPRGGHLLVTAGQVLHVHSLATGQCISKYGHSALETNVGWEEGTSTAPLQVDGSRDGRMVLLAGSDGAIIALDLRAPKQPAALLWDQASPVKDLKFEDPWLAAATYSGSVLLLDVEAVLRGGGGSGEAVASQRRIAGRHRGFQGKQRAVRHRLSGPKGAACCVDIADNFLACGSADPVVRTWDFQQPESDAGRPLTAPRRQSRGSRRQRNRFPFAPDSDSGSSSDDESTGGPGELACGQLREEANIPLSHSLPACLGGTGMSFANRHGSHARSGSSSIAAASQGGPSDVAGQQSEDSEDARSDAQPSDCEPGVQRRADSAGRHNREQSEGPPPRTGCSGSGRFRVPVPLPVRCRPEVANAELGNSMESWQLWQSNREQQRRNHVKARG